MLYAIWWVQVRNTNKVGTQYHFVNWSRRKIHRQTANAFMSPGASTRYCYYYDLDTCVHVNVEMNCLFVMQYFFSSSVAQWRVQVFVWKRKKKSGMLQILNIVWNVKIEILCNNNYMFPYNKKSEHKLAQKYNCESRCFGQTEIYLHYR